MVYAARQLVPFQLTMKEAHNLLLLIITSRCGCDLLPRFFALAAGAKDLTHWSTGSSSPSSEENQVKPPNCQVNVLNDI